MPLMALSLVLGLSLNLPLNVCGQAEPSRRLLPLVSDEPLRGQPQRTVPVGRYFNDFESVLTNLVLRLALAPVHSEDGIGSGHPFSPFTDLSGGVAAGAVGDLYDGVGTGACSYTPAIEVFPGGCSPGLYSVSNPDPPMPATGLVPADFRYGQFQFPRELLRSDFLGSLSRFEPPRRWQLGGGYWLSYAWPNQVFRFGLRGGRSLFESGESYENDHFLAVLFRFTLGRRKPAL